MHNTSVASIGICSHRKLSLHHLPREKVYYHLFTDGTYCWMLWLCLWFPRAPLNSLAPLTLLHLRLTGFCFPFLCDTLPLQHISMQGITSRCNNFVAIHLSPLVFASPHSFTSPLSRRLSPLAFSPNSCSSSFHV